MKLRRSPPLVSGLCFTLLLTTVVLAGCNSITTTVSSSDARLGPDGLPVRGARQAAKLEAWRDAEKLASLGQDRTSVAGAGESMAPVYNEDSLLVIAKVGYHELAAGMNVAYRSREGRQVVHQLIEPTPDGWRVRGLNNGDADRERVTSKNLLGVVYASLDATVAGASTPATE